MNYKRKQELGEILTTASPLLSLIPGAGIPLSLAAGVAGQALENSAQKDIPSAKFAGVAYGSGGPINPNIQNLGKISFDSNKGRSTGKGYYVVKDIKTKKDYGVVRNPDGSYRFYDKKQDPIRFKLLQEGYPLQEIDKLTGSMPIDRIELNAGEKRSYYNGYTGKTVLRLPSTDPYKSKDGRLDLEAARKDLSDRYIAEASHAIQDKHLNTDSSISHIKDTLRPGGYDSTYDIPGTHEYTAHRVIEGALKRSINRPSVNIQRIGNYIVDTDLSTQNADGSLSMYHLASGKTPKDGIDLQNSAKIIVKRRANGSYDLLKTSKLTQPDEVEKLNAYLQGVPETYNTSKHRKTLANAPELIDTYNELLLTATDSKTRQHYQDRLKELTEVTAAYAPRPRSYKSGGLMNSSIQTVNGIQFGNNTGKSKSSDRYREMSTGGKLNQVSSTAAHVQGNPNQIDSVHIPELNIRLDDNEIVKNGFVFSNRITNPQTGNKFAADAKRIENRTAKAEKRAEKGNDPFSANSIKYNNAMSDKLAQQHEIVATALDKRSSTGFSTGGPVYMKAKVKSGVDMNQMQSGALENTYYDPESGKFLYRGPRGAYSTYFDAGNFFQVPTQSEIDAHRVYVANYQEPVATNAAPAFTNTQDILNSMQPPTASIVTQPNQQPVPKPARKPGIRPVKTPTVPTLPKYPNLPDLPQEEEIGPGPLQFPDDLANGPWLAPDMQRPVNIGESINARGTTTPGVENNTIPQGLANLQGSASVGSGYDPTLGDALQVAAVGSRVVDAFRKPEVQKFYGDSTQISKVSYDPSVPLQQNNANYANAVGNTSASSPNLRRAILNQLFATKLNADSGVLDRYQNMNNAATVDYENRLSGQKRYNNAQAYATDDINAQNRAASMYARQAAMDSIGYTGQALNDRKTVQQQLDILKELYPIVSKRFIQ